MARIAPPDVVVSDGGRGFEKARRAVWPATRVQRCTFHAFGQVKRCTTTRPRLQAGAELYGIAIDLLHLESLDEAAGWLASFARWCAEWDGFLKEKAVVDGTVKNLAHFSDSLISPPSGAATPPAESRPDSASSPTRSRPRT